MSFQAMAWATEQDVPAMQKIVLLMLANCTNHYNGQCNPSHESLAKDCGMSVRSCKDQIGKLAEAGFLEIVKRSKDGISLPNQYTLAMPKGRGHQMPTGGQEMPDGGAGGARGVGQEVPTNQEDKPRTEPGKTYIANPAPKKYDAMAALLEIGVPAQVAADWLEVRKGKKSAPTKTAIDDVLESLAEAGYSPADGIKLCAVKGWAGFNKKWLVESQAQQRPQHTRQPAQSSHLGPAGQATAAAAERLMARLKGDSNANN